MFSSQNSQVSSAANYIEDVFSTYLYTGTGTAAGSTQTITNGIDLAGKGGMVWIKDRAIKDHFLFDTNRGPWKYLRSNTTDAQPGVNEDALSAFNSNGFTLTGDNNVTQNGQNYVSWTFREQPKFFDVVTYTGNNATSRQIAHSLGSTPACIIVKCTNASANWVVYHKDLSTDSGTVDSNNLVLNSTAAQSGGGCFGDDAYQTSTYFTLGRLGSGFNDTFNKTGNTYVAYLFAHNAGGFGLTGTDNVISCGIVNGASAPTVNLGYEPQFVMFKAANTTGNWLVYDNMRGWTANNGSGAGNVQQLLPNTSGAETATTSFYTTSTGFAFGGSTVGFDYIYIAIRRGPMKVPTSGTSVFSPVFPTSTTTPSFSTGWPVDLAMHKLRESASFGTNAATRLQGTPELFTSDTNAESTDTSNVWASNSGYGNGFSVTTTNIGWMFRRAPSFVDVLCYTGNGTTNNTISHNLQTPPEMMIVRDRAGSTWYVYHQALGNQAYGQLSTTLRWYTSSDGVIAQTIWKATTPTSSVFYLGNASNGNGNGSNYIAYLYATCSGVSKVGSYTGTGTTKQIDCGFTGGARFVLIKRTDSTGDWYVWDSARGIVAGNDPYLLLNSTAAEITNTDYIDTYSAGFEISSTAPAAINASGGTFIFLAIA